MKNLRNGQVKMTNNIKDFTLCQNNNFVSGNLRDLKKYLKAIDVLTPRDTKVIYDTINTCLEDLRIMKKQGQSLESRCKKYRRAVESCGFVRVGDNK